MRHTQREIARTALLLALLAGLNAPRYLGAQSSAEPPDKYLWLEDVSGERALSWVKAENERSAKVLESDPRYPELHAAALKVREAPERLPIPWLNGDDMDR
jgi:prolyl oligopeptidase